ncbi:hypothetical protein NA57DRAFT_69855 [Rhizodiscina lignyota]|uniref:Inositol-pentakisphosphate 2-kinase n=1 Tax=Rhizodiscina lignyota TaxID=1504668 RepID=A0A9P4ILB7_9PEZI|nr:hypothetical protein NA57DRAFT_69855 [Rhizodiscina lignyota]
MNDNASGSIPEVYAAFSDDGGLLAIAGTTTTSNSTTSKSTISKSSLACIALEYFSEGGANVVYSLRPALVEKTIHGLAGARLGTTTESPNLARRLQGKVLRLRKVQEPAQGDAETTPYVPTAEVERYLHEGIEPRLGTDYLVKHDMIKVDPKLIKACNSALATGEEAKVRPKRRKGDRLNENEPHALLLDDMRPEPGVSFMIEFKPKWLSDSPNPQRLKRRRCRTCALRTMRNAEKGKKAGRSPTAGFCPLALTSSGAALEKIIDHFLFANGVQDHPLWKSHGDRVTERLAQDFTSGSTVTLLSRLRELENDLDPHGCLSFEGHQQLQNEGALDDLELAMTLRDCTIFARLTWEPSGPLELRLADLDRKDWRTRLERWCATERALIDGGWYEGAEKNADILRPREICQLWAS